MPPRSLQNRLLLSFLVSMTAILAGGGFVIYTVIGKHLAEENDLLLRDRLAFYESTLRLGYLRKTPQVAVFSRITEPEWERINKTENPDMVKVWYAADGKFLMRSPSLRVKDPEVTPDPANQPHDPPRPAVYGDEPVFMNYTLWDGRPARLISRKFVPSIKEDPKIPDVYMQVVVGRDLLTLEATASKVRWFLVKIGLAVVAVLLVASRFIIRRGVKPVNSLADQIEVIPLAEGGDRFGLPGAPTELQPVVGRLNALMDRVSAAIEHERQFASNAAHELRNPLAAIRSTIEVALSRDRKGEEYEEALESIWHSQQGMQRVVDHLLLLARLESGHGAAEFVTESAVLGRMLKKSWRNCIDVAEEKKLRVAWQVEDPEAEIVAVISLLEIVFTNLLQNAVNYTPAGGEIRIHAAIRDGRCVVAVENTNPGLTQGALENTFTPFWRADPNASGHRGNAGIGLALCRRIAMTLGGGMRATLTTEGMVQYAAEFPVTPPQDLNGKKLRPPEPSRPKGKPADFAVQKTNSNPEA
ncbi:MAG TPA: HAMP domain-containing sensor histidine kinase [Verrucomicrobiales bacterium]|nr:HAMP domain-containing sensor histidine kinase [Verrucomicrobiales bacterium]